MRVWDGIFPEYGLAGHKGYATPEHIKALEEYGPTPLAPPRGSARNAEPKAFPKSLTIAANAAVN